MNSILIYLLGMKFGETFGFVGWLDALSVLVTSAIGIVINWIILYIL